MEIREAFLQRASHGHFAGMEASSERRDPPRQPAPGHRGSRAQVGGSHLALLSGHSERGSFGFSKQGALGAAVAAGALVVCLVAVVAAVAGVAAPSSRPPAHAPAAPAGGHRQAPPSISSGVVVIDQVDTTGTVNLGGITAGLDSVDVGGDLFGPGGPQLKPDIAVGVEPGSAVDGLVVPLVGGLTGGTGQIVAHTPGIGSLTPIGVNVGVDGRITATVHQFEGLP